MKRLIGALLALLLLLTLSPCREAFAADAFPAPGVSLRARDEGPSDVRLTFSLASPDGKLYEENRRALYETMRGSFTDEEIELAGEDWLLKPLCLLVEAEVGKTPVSVKTADVTADAFEVSLCEDVLPALVKNGLYTHESFLYTLRFSLVLDLGDALLPVSGDIAAGPYACPETAHIAYDLPEGAVNPNPAFPFLPFAGMTLQNPAHEGYIFDGWVKDGAGVAAVPAGALDFSLSSNWTPRVFRVHYVLPTREGPFIFVNNADNPTTHVYGESPRLYDLTPPAGYVFAGWFEDPGFSGERIRSIPAKRLGDLILYAKWLTPEEQLDEEIARFHWGDLDSDGKVTASDARLALRQAVELERLDPRLIRRADFAGKGALTAEDARVLLRLSVELDTLPEVLRQYGRIKGEEER